MSKDEVKKILSIVFSTYPSFKPKVDAKTLVDTWADVLADTPYTDAYSNLVRYIRSGNEYAPNVSQLVNKQSQVYGFVGRTYSHEFFEEIERENERMLKDGSL